MINKYSDENINNLLKSNFNFLIKSFLQLLKKYDVLRSFKSHFIHYQFLKNYIQGNENWELAKKLITPLSINKNQEKAYIFNGHFSYVAYFEDILLDKFTWAATVEGTELWSKINAEWLNFLRDFYKNKLDRKDYFPL